MTLDPLKSVSGLRFTNNTASPPKVEQTEPMDVEQADQRDTRKRAGEAFDRLAKKPRTEEHQGSAPQAPNSYQIPSRLCPPPTPAKKNLYYSRTGQVPRMPMASLSDTATSSMDRSPPRPQNRLNPPETPVVGRYSYQNPSETSYFSKLPMMSLTGSTTCPETPMKKNRGASRVVRHCPPPVKVLTPYAQGAQRRDEQLNSGRFFPFTVKMGDQEDLITERIKYLGRGKINDAYLVKGVIGSGSMSEAYLKAYSAHLDSLQESPDKRLPMPQAENETQFVLKIPQKKFREEGLQKHFKKILTDEAGQYPTLLKRFAPLEKLLGHRCIARHYNLDALQELGSYSPEQMTHGCYVVEYVPNPYPIDKWQDELSPEGTLERKADDQLKEIFRFAYEHKEWPLDMERPNVHVDALGNVVLIDPMCPEPDPEEEAPAFKIHLQSALLAFAPANSARIRYLDPRNNA